MTTETSTRPTIATYRRKSQTQVDRDRRRAETHRTHLNVIAENSAQASDFTASSSRADPPLPPPPPSDILVCDRPTSAHMPDVNNSASRHDDYTSAARETCDTEASPQQAQNTVTGVKVQQKPTHQPAVETACDNIGLRHEDNEYRRRLRSARRHVAPDTSSSPAPPRMPDPEIQTIENQLSEIVRIQSENHRQLQLNLQSNYQRLQDMSSIGARVPTSSFQIPSTRTKFRPDQR